MKTKLLLFWAIQGFISGCYQSAPGDADTAHVDTSTDAPSQNTDDAAMDTIDSESDTADVGPLPSPCDDLSNEECLDSDDSCGVMYVHPTEPPQYSDVVWASCKEGTIYGCTSRLNCHEEIEVALDAEGVCWWLPRGCLPNEPGWKLAVDDAFCKSPVRRHSCIL